MKTRKRLIFISLFLALLTVLAVGLSACNNDIVVRISFYKVVEVKGEMKDVLYETVELGKDGSYTMPEAPTESGYVFENWYTSKDWGTAFTSGATLENSISVYAKFRKLPVAPTNLKWDNNGKFTWKAPTGELNPSYEVTITKNGTALTPEVVSVCEYPLTEPGNYSISVKTINATNDKSENAIMLEDITIVAPVYVYTIEFMDKSSDGWYKYNTEVLDEDFVIPTRANETTRKFVGWFTKNGTDSDWGDKVTDATTLFDTAKAENQTVQVYAKWETKPTVPTAPSVRYQKGTTSEVQKLVWTDATANVANYVVEIYNGETLVEKFDNVTEKFVTLTKSKYVVDTEYTVKIKTVSTNVWEEAPIESPWATTYFTYVITPDVYHLDAPTEVTYTANTLTLSWEAVTAATAYQYNLDGSGWESSTTNSVKLYGLSKGNHTVILRATTATGTGETSSIAFTVSEIYVEVSDNDAISYVRVDDNGKIEQPDAAGKDGYMFVKWALTDSAENDAIDFATTTFSATTRIYAIYLVRPSQVADLSYDTTAYKFSWTPISGAKGYKVKLSGEIDYTFVSVAEYGQTILDEGDYTLEIITVTEVGGNEVYSLPVLKTVRISAIQGNITYVNDNNTIYIDANGNSVREATDIAVYFAGQSYTISGHFHSASEYFSVVGNSGQSIKFVTDPEKLNKVFDIEYQDSTGKAKTMKAMIVPGINAILYSEGYAVYKNKTDDGSATFLDKTQPYTVGTNGTFNFGLGLQYSGGAVFDDTAVDFVVSYKLNGEVKDATTMWGTYGARVIKKDGRYSLSFDSTKSGTLVGKTLEVTFTARFMSKAQKDEGVNSSAIKTFALLINNGVNVNNHEQLKAAFEGTASVINIHDNITAQLDANQMNDDGSAVCNNSDVKQTVDQEGVKVHADVYRRDVNADGTLTLNGNYCLINASSVAKLYAQIDERGESIYKSPTEMIGVGDDYRPADTQVGLNGIDRGVQNVHMSVLHVIGNGTADFTLEVNSLEILGNTLLSGIDQEAIKVYSGGHNGIMVAEANLECYNTNIHNTTIAYFFDSADIPNNNSTLTRVIADQNWANGIYLHGTTALKLIDSRMLSSSGAAIHFEDGNGSAREQRENFDGTDVRRDPAVIIDTNTVLENWVAGNEAWFTAWGFGGTAVPMLKNALQSAVSTNFGTSILKTDKQLGGSEETITKFNFAMMFKNGNDFGQLHIKIVDGAGNELTSYVHVGPAVNTTDPYQNILPDYTKDLRITGGQLLTCMNRFSNTARLQQALALMQYIAGADTTSYPASVTAYTDLLLPVEKCIVAYFCAAGDETAYGYILSQLGPTDQLDLSAKGTLAYIYSLFNGTGAQQAGYALMQGYAYTQPINFVEGEQNHNFYSVVLPHKALEGSSDSPTTFWLEYGNGENWWFNSNP